jgi:hypothetical protein
VCREGSLAEHDAQTAHQSAVSRQLNYCMGR